MTIPEAPTAPTTRKTPTAPMAPTAFDPMLRGGFRAWHALGAGSGLAFMVSMLLMVAACGGGGASDEGGAAGGDAVGGGASGEVGAAGGDGLERSDRLVDYIGVSMFGNNPEEQRAFEMRQEQKVQDFVAECMALRGFEYIPAVRPRSDSADGGDSAEVVAREQGFGITTQFGDSGTDGPPIDGPPRVANDGWADPNDEITAALSEAEMQAYYDALYETAEATPLAADGTEEATAGDSADGCINQAYEEVYSFFDVMGQLNLESLSQAIRSDPQTQTVFDEWSQCMRTKGYEYDDPGDMRAKVFGDLESRLEQITDTSGISESFADISPDGVDQPTVDELSEDSDELADQADADAQPEIDQEALAELQAEEREIAIADFECSEEMQLDERLDGIAAPYEAQFIEENRALLEGAADTRNE